MSNLPKLLEFISFTHYFQQVKRLLFATGEDRDENDAEHSFQLALVGWYLNESEQLNLESEKIIKYALAHDLIEVYAGDTYFHTTDQELLATKEKREKEALEAIKEQFQEFSELHDIIAQYESKADEEARFVYALDKLLPVLNIYLDNGRSWERDKVTYEMIRTKDTKITVSPVVEKIWHTVVHQLLEKNRFLFFQEK